MAGSFPGLFKAVHSPFQTRLKTPQTRAEAETNSPVLQPFITISREACAGATALGEKLVPLLDEQLGEEGRSWIFLDKDLITHALTKHQLPERLSEYLPEDRVSETVRPGNGTKYPAGHRSGPAALCAVQLLGRLRGPAWLRSRDQHRPHHTDQRRQLGCLRHARPDAICRRQSRRRPVIQNAPHCPLKPSGRVVSR